MGGERGDRDIGLFPAFGFAERPTMAAFASDPAIARFAYDAHGRVTSLIDAQGHTTVYDYSVSSVNPTENLRRTQIGSDSTIFEYDALGRLLAQVDPVGNRSEMSYDVLNRDTLWAQGGRDVRVSYSAPMAIPSVTTKLNGQIYTQTFNRLGWVMSYKHAEGGSDTFTYDANGSLRSAHNRRGQAITYAYDFWDRLARSTIPSGSGSQILTYDTDPLDRWTVMTYPDGRDSVAFDAAGRPAHETIVRGGRTYAISRSFYNGFPLYTALNGPGVADTIFATVETSHQRVVAMRDLGTHDSTGVSSTDECNAGY
jgi:YD repeat-containing protein